jgi:class 3 adenylate cyclase/tetratricopeptide (TPR) repeat protein
VYERVLDMKCSSCGAENPAGHKFCGSCGTALAAICSSCGTANYPEQKFCGECGVPLAPSAASGLASAPVDSAGPEASTAERRLVSVLFADLVGFTTLSEARDAEEVRELLSRYFDICRRLIALYGGTVEKFIGDAVMAVWGTPTATEDDAERAVRAALDLVAAVSALGDEVGAPELRARAGVHTGEAAVTLGAEGQGMVAGDLVNTASRVQSVAEAGSVYVGDSTRRATEPTVVFEEAGSFELKGKEGLTPLWKALRVVSGVRGSRKSQGLEAPFVGRDGELRLMKDLFHTSADERKAHLVSITGIAGIGKSRLAWEFYKYFDGIAETISWHSGRCLAYGEGVTYWALAEMVRMRCRIAEDEEAASATTKLGATVEEYIPDADERRFVEPRLAQLLGLGAQEFSERQELFAAWRLLFERIADVNPTVLLFEDMQWADASLLDFVEYLLDWSRNSPLFVVALARPEFAERRPTWGAGLRNFTSVYLEPLQEAAMEELLAGLVPGLPDSLCEQILARAEGVPLYAVETVRMLLDRGALVPDGPVYRPVAEFESLDVPETLHALIAARLDGLSGEERKLVQDGAVLGKTFTRRALATVSGLTGDKLEPLLSSLVRKEVLGVQADPRSPEHGQYGFLQDLLRRVAYETLSKRERRTRHLAAAEQLAASFGEEEIAEVVAFHLLEAYRAVPDADDAAEIKRRSRDALARAGERAASVAAAAEAQRYFEQAAELADDPIDQTPLIDRAGQMAFRASRSVEARALLERAHAAYEAARESRLAAHVSARLAEIDFMEGHPHEAVTRMEPALAALSAGPADADVAVVAERLGRMLTLGGEQDRAAPHIEYALELASALNLPETLAHALSTRGVYLMARDRYYEARVVLGAALALALEHGHHFAALRAYSNLAEALDSCDEFVDAYELRLQALDLARLAGERTLERSSLADSVVGLHALGRWDEALTRVGEAEAITNLSWVQIGLLASVPIRCARGELEPARAQLIRLASVGESEDPQAIAAYAAAEAGLLLAEGKPAEARDAAERALATRQAQGVNFWAVKAAFVEALEASFALADRRKILEHVSALAALDAGVRTPLLRAQQARFEARLDPVEAANGFDTAEEIFRALGTPFYLAVTLLEHGESLLEKGRSDEAGPLLAEARKTFERLGATPWLERTAPALRMERQTEVAS